MPVGAKSHPRPSDCIVNASVPASAATPPLPGSPGSSGRFVGGKSGTSFPVHVPVSSSHQTHFFRSLHGRPSGSAEARL